MAPAMLLSYDTEISYRRERLLADARHRRLVASALQSSERDRRVPRLRRRAVIRTAAIVRHV